MKRLVLQFGREEAGAYLVRPSAGRGELVQPGPRLSLPGALSASDRHAWLSVLRPLEQFLDEQRFQPASVVLVPMETSFELITLPRVPKMGADEVVESHLRFHTGAGGQEVHWSYIPVFPNTPPNMLTFAALSIEQGLARRLREIPAALGFPEAEVQVLPYPLAAARALQRSLSGSIEPAAILEIGDSESTLTVAWQSIPLRYVRLNIGIADFVSVLCTRVAVEGAAPVALSPDQASALLDTLDFAQLQERIADETEADIRQVLQGLTILLGNLRDDVNRVLNEVGDTLEFEVDCRLVRSTRPLKGIHAFLGQRGLNGDWAPLELASTADFEWENGKIEAPAPATAVVLGIESKWDAAVQWRDYGTVRDRSGLHYAVLQMVALVLLTLCGGIAIGYASNYALASAATLRSDPAPEGDLQRADALFGQITAIQNEAAHRLATLRNRGAAERTDAICREFLGDISPYDYTNLCLDEISITITRPAGGVAEGTGTPVANLIGRAATPEGELQDFVSYLTRLASVEQAVLENVESNSEPGLTCRFQIKAKLKPRTVQ